MKKTTTATKQEDAAAAVLAAKKKSTKNKAAANGHGHDDELRYRAKRWAELHANPKTRIEMDTLLKGLTEADQRIVILNGMRIGAGLAPKH